MKKSKLKAVDFFCGAGGVSTGFSSLGINILGGIDIDKNCQATYLANHPNAKFIGEDISQISFESLTEILNVKPQEDNLIFVGCSPCQYYTKIRTSKEKSEKSKLLLEEFERFVDHFRPGYVFIENVPGIEKKAGSPLASFKENLRAWGYKFTDKVLHAEHYGVPQTRRRYVLMATRLEGELNFPEAKPDPELNVKNAIGSTDEFPEVKPGHVDKSDWLHSVPSLSPINIKRLERTSKDGGTRLDWKNDPDLQLPCYQGKDHLFRNIYSRMFWKKPAPTITTKFLRISNGRFAHPEQNRGLSIREGATLQTFPKEYKFVTESLDVAARLIGNAVPPKMAEKLGESILNHWTKCQNSEQKLGR